MGMTMTQKILAAHAGLPSVEAGQLIMADLDLVLANDITGPVAIHEVHWCRITLHQIRILSLQNTANVFVSMPKSTTLRIILK